MIGWMEKEDIQGVVTTSMENREKVKSTGIQINIFNYKVEDSIYTS